MIAEGKKEQLKSFEQVQLNLRIRIFLSVLSCSPAREIEL